MVHEQLHLLRQRHLVNPVLRPQFAGDQPPSRISGSWVSYPLRFARWPGWFTAALGLCLALGGQTVAASPVEGLGVFSNSEANPSFGSGAFARAVELARQNALEAALLAIEDAGAPSAGDARARALLDFRVWKEKGVMDRRPGICSLTI